MRQHRESLADRLDRDAIWGFPCAFVATVVCAWASFEASPVLLAIGLAMLAVSVWLAVDHWRVAHQLKRIKRTPTPDAAEVSQPSEREDLQVVDYRRLNEIAMTDPDARWAGEAAAELHRRIQTGSLDAPRSS